MSAQRSPWYRQSIPRNVAGVSLAGAAVLAMIPVIPPYIVSVLTLASIFAIFALGLNVLMGFAGLESLGQAAFFGTSAYVIGILTTRVGLPWVTALIAGLVTSFLMAMLFGLIAVRLGGLYFLLITLALSQVLWAAALRLGDFTGGWNGLRVASVAPDFLRVPSNFLAVCILLVIVVFTLTLILHASPFGLALLGIREREVRLTTLGFNTFWHKYVAFVIAGTFAGLAGALSVTYNSFVSPRDLSLALSFDVMLMVILGGSGTLIGPIIGALLVTGLKLLLSVWLVDLWRILLGLVFIAVTIWLPRGVMGVEFGRLRSLWWPRSRRGKTENSATPMPESLPKARTATDRMIDRASKAPRPAGIEESVGVSGLSKQFGGVSVLSDLDLAAGSGERVGIIGLNGAGKTTLFQLLTGLYVPSSGTIRVLGKDVTDRPANQRNALGLARTFQITALFPRLTVGQNMTLALLGRKFAHLKFVAWRRAENIPELAALVRERLDDVGLAHLEGVVVDSLSYGHQRQLELGLALASDPAVLLLDEPTAGLAQAEIPAMTELLLALPEDLTILIVEHNLEVIFELVDRVVVLHEGRLLADGTAEEVRSDEQIRELYFGTRVK